MKKLNNLVVKFESRSLFLETLTIENMSTNYLDWVNNPDVVRYLEIRHTRQTQNTINEFVRNCFMSSTDLLMGIFTKDDGEHIGNIKIGSVNWRYMRAEIGLIIGDKGKWGKGYGTESIEKVTEIAKSELGLQRISASVCSKNAASVRAFLKAGFEKEGVLKSFWIVDDEIDDEVMLGKVFSS